MGVKGGQGGRIEEGGKRGKEGGRRREGIEERSEGDTPASLMVRWK